MCRSQVEELARDAATEIQRCYRGHLGRRLAQALRDIRDQERQLGQEEAQVPLSEAEVQAAAAATIQAGFRAWRQRRRFEALRRAVIRIQSVWRGWRVRQHNPPELAALSGRLRLSRQRSLAHLGKEHRAALEELLRKAGGAGATAAAPADLSGLLDPLQALHASSRAAGALAEDLVDRGGLAALIRLLPLFRRTPEHIRMIQQVFCILDSVCSLDGGRLTGRLLEETELLPAMGGLLRLFRDNEVVFSGAALQFYHLCRDPRHARRLAEDPRTVSTLQDVAVLLRGKYNRAAAFVQLMGSRKEDAKVRAELSSTAQQGLIIGKQLDVLRAVMDRMGLPVPEQLQPWPELAPPPQKERGQGPVRPAPPPPPPPPPPVSAPAPAPLPVVVSAAPAPAAVLSFNGHVSERSASILERARRLHAGLMQPQAKASFERQHEEPMDVSEPPEQASAPTPIPALAKEQPPAQMHHPPVAPIVEQQRPVLSEPPAAAPPAGPAAPVTSMAAELALTVRSPRRSPIRQRRESVAQFIASLGFKVPGQSSPPRLDGIAPSQAAQAPPQPQQLGPGWQQQEPKRPSFEFPQLLPQQQQVTFASNLGHSIGVPVQQQPAALFTRQAVEAHFGPTTAAQPLQPMPMPYAQSQHQPMPSVQPQQPAGPLLAAQQQQPMTFAQPQQRPVYLPPSPKGIPAHLLVRHRVEPQAVPVIDLTG